MTSSYPHQKIKKKNAVGADLVTLDGRHGDRIANYIKTDTPRAINRIPLISAQNVLDVVPVGSTIIGVELTEDAKDLVGFNHPKSAFYVFWPEGGSLKQDVLCKCNAVVKIPSVICLNLAAAVNVVLYDRLTKDMKRKRV